MANLTKEKNPSGIFKEVAKILGCSVSTATQRYHRCNTDAINAVAEVKLKRKSDLKEALQKLKVADEMNPYEINKN